MPSLANIYSTIDSFKRRLGDTVANPIQSIQQGLGNANDQARVLNQQLAESTQEFPKYGPKTQNLAEKLAAGYNPTGMTVWHGSPYKFKAFDSSKIGTGEGAQVFGHGIYVAENPNVAKKYKEDLSKDVFNVGGEIFDPFTLKHRNIRALVNRGNLDEAINRASEITYSNSPVAHLAAEDLSVLKNIKKKGGLQPHEGSLYQIDLPDKHINKMLDWDKTLINQPKSVQEAIKDIPHEQTGFTYGDIIESIKAAPHLNDPNDYSWAHPTGQEIYKNLGKSMMVGNNAKGQVEASKALSDIGIPGIKYLDQNSRDLQEGTQNFVIFPDNTHLLDIQNINGETIK